MKLNISIATNSVTLEFDTPRDRDVFWKGMANNPTSSGFTSQHASRKVGTRVIEIDPTKMKVAYAWPFVAVPLVPNGEAKTVEVEEPKSTPKTVPVPVVQMPEPPPAIPIPEITEVPTVPVETESPPAPVVDDPEPTGDKRSREYRMWRDRQKAKQA